MSFTDDLVINAEMENLTIDMIIENIKTQLPSFRRFFSDEEGYNGEICSYSKDFIRIQLWDIDRGPRTDHGGGDDGDEWMEDHQVEDLLCKYKEKNASKVERVIAHIITFCPLPLFKKDKPDWDYGEKGHIAVSFSLSPLEFTVSGVKVLTDLKRKLFIVKADSGDAEVSTFGEIAKLVTKKKRAPKKKG